MKAGVLALQAEFGSFDAYLQPYADDSPQPRPPREEPGSLPNHTPEAVALSADLRRRGFRFVGPTVVYSFMQSVGLVDDHLPGCFRYVGRH